MGGRRRRGMKRKGSVTIRRKLWMGRREVEMEEKREGWMRGTDRWWYKKMKRRETQRGE